MDVSVALEIVIYLAVILSQNTLVIQRDWKNNKIHYPSSINWIDKYFFLFVKHYG